MASHGYRLRTSRNRNYRDLSDVHLPRVTRSVHKQRDKLYPVEVVQTAGSRVKVHYIGYDDSSDEWHELGDIVTTNRRDPTNTRKSVTQVQPYSLYKELGIKIKQALVYGRKQSPVVKISMAFDYLLFKGGLQTAGTPARCVQGYQRYKIECYSNLDFLLGPNWHYRGVNEHGDYSYTVLDSIEFYLHKRPKLTEYYPSQTVDSETTKVITDTGYLLTFSFVRGYGNGSTFGKDRNIFSGHTV